MAATEPAIVVQNREELWWLLFEASQLDLLPFDEAGLTHFLYLERPEGMERVDAPGFVPTAPPHEAVELSEAFPRVQDFATVGHLYRGMERGLDSLVERLGERAVFVSPKRAQCRPEELGWPELTEVTDLASAHAAIDRIIEQGEGARGDWRDAHYGRFLQMWEQYQTLKKANPSFQPARPVTPAFTKQPYDVAEAQTIVTEALTSAVAELFAIG